MNDELREVTAPSVNRVVRTDLDHTVPNDVVAEVGTNRYGLKQWKPMPPRVEQPPKEVHQHNVRCQHCDEAFGTLRKSIEVTEDGSFRESGKYECQGGCARQRKGLFRKLMERRGRRVGK